MIERMNDKTPRDVVEKAAAALREVAVPAGPSEELMNKTLSRLGAGERTMGSQEKGWWTMRVVRRSAAAAGIVLVVTAGLVAMLMGRGQVAFADVVEQVKARQAVRCKMVVEIEQAGAPGGKVVQESDTLMVAPGWTIVTTPTMKMIMSTEQGKMVTLMSGMKQAMVMEMKNMPATAPRMVNLLDVFKNVDGKEGKPLGQREINGKSVRGFEVSNGGMLMKVWADATTELPVLVEMTPVSPIMPAGTYTMKDFDWNPKYEASELSVEVPTGYQAVNASMDASKGGEQDAVGMLRTLAEINNGQFPASVGVEGFSKVTGERMATRMVKETRGMTPEQKSEWQHKMMGEIMQLAAPIGRGWAFIGDVKQGTEWHYAGAGVSQGEKGHAVLWYKRSDGTWRVIDADLSVHDAKETDLPQGEAVKLMFPTGKSTLPAAGAPATLPGK